MKDDFLYKFQKPPRKEFMQALYKRISKPMLSKTALLTKRLTYAVVILLTVATFTFTFSPTARVMASDFLRQIGVLFISERPAGDPVLISSPSPEQSALAQATATPIIPITETVSPFETAISQAGFSPFLPSTLPKGYSFSEVVAAEYLDDQQVPYGWGIFVTYLTEDGGYLSIHTNRFDQRQQDIPTGGKKVTDVNINGNTGVWIEDFYARVGTSNDMVDMLLWEENGYVLAIQSNHLSLEEVLGLAQSLEQ